MARRKKRRKKLSRKELKQRRQAAMARKRKEQGWTPPQAHPSHHDDDVFEDMLPLFPLAGDTSVLPDATAERLMMTLLDSADLIEEPEFEEIIIDPIRSVDTFAEIGEELGIDPEALSRLPDEEREDTQMEMLVTTTQRLLTDDLRQDVVDGLNNLRLRLKRSGKREQVAQAAALQSFLRDNEDDGTWSMIGLVQAIVQRSLEAGFELYEASMEVMETGRLDEGETPLTLSEKLAQSSLAQRADAVLRKVPGLSGFLEKQADKIWEEGMEAIFEGDLYLELFTLEELEAGSDIFETALGGGVSQETASQEIPSLTVTEEKAKSLISRVDEYITELFTPERLDQLRARLNTTLNDPDCPKEWLAFIMMLGEYMAAEDAVENEKPFLIRAFFGEMRVAGADSEEA